MVTDEQNWLKKFEEPNAVETAKVKVVAENCELILARVETEGRVEFTIAMGNATARLIPAQVLRLVQMLVALADLEPGK